MRRILITALLATIGALGVNACGNDGSGGADGDGASGASDTTVAGADLPAACEQPPLTMRLEAGGNAPAGGPQVQVLDAVARRVPLLPGLETTGDPAEMAERESLAAETELALYSIYLGDHDIDHSPLEQYGFGDLQPGPGETLGVLTIVPPTEAGFSTGDVADGTPLAYDVNTTFTPLGLTVLAGAPEGAPPAAAQGFTDAEGEVEILAVDDDWICVDIDVELRNGDTVVYAAEGIVAAPIVRPPASFYFT